ncbi:hypothetical protein [Paenibacillus brasilensis]|nr:hypothetical protein [Paenibacillus brasilensis]
MALFYFTLFYALIRIWSGKFIIQMNYPNKVSIFYFILAVGSLNFITRLIFPTNRLYIHDFSLGYFPQFLLFWMEIVAYRNNWLENIDTRLAAFYFRISLISIITLPIVFLLVDLYGGNLDAFYGGITSEALYYSFWEPFTSIGIILKLHHPHSRWFFVSHASRTQRAIAHIRGACRPFLLFLPYIFQINSPLVITMDSTQP